MAAGALASRVFDGPPLGHGRGPRLYRKRLVAVPVRPRSRRAIGLLGGSFNPAHEGHRYISLQAIKRLALDEVWWLVSPQNPLKPRAGMAPFAERFSGAERVARHPRIRVSGLEAELGTTYTAETLRRLHAMPGQRFIWLIGADNLLQLPKWQHWECIFALAPIAVFARTPYSQGAVASKAWQRFARARIAETAAHTLKDTVTPAWTFIHLPPHPASSTAIRAGASPVQPREIRP